MKFALLACVAFAIPIAGCATDVGDVVTPRSIGEALASPPFSATYYWGNVEVDRTHQCLKNVPGPSHTELTVVPCDGRDPLQMFREDAVYVTLDGRQQSGVYLKNVAGLCLDDWNYNDGSKHAPMGMQACGNFTSEQWVVDTNAEFHNVGTGWCAEASSVTAFVNYCDSTHGAQKWNLEKFNHPVPRNGFQGMRTRCLDDGGRAFNGSPIVAFDCLDNQYQHFALDSITGQLVDSLDGRCLEIKNYDDSNGATVQKWDCYGGVNQQWYFTADGQLVSYMNNKCMEIDSYSFANDARIQMWDCYGGFNQIWEHDFSR